MDMFCLPMSNNPFEESVLLVYLVYSCSFILFTKRLYAEFVRSGHKNENMKMEIIEVSDDTDTENLKIER